MDNASTTVQNNILHQNNNGMKLINGASPNVTDNQIIANNNGISIESTQTNPTNPLINSNTIVANSNYNILTSCPSGSCASQTINAENNWWGTTVLNTINDKIYDQLDNPNN